MLAGSWFLVDPEGPGLFPSFFSDMRDPPVPGLGHIFKMLSPSVSGPGPGPMSIAFIRPFDFGFNPSPILV